MTLTYLSVQLMAIKRDNAGARVAITIEGHDAMLAMLDQQPKNFRSSVVQTTLRKLSTPIRQTARQLAPKDTGKLKKSIVLKTKFFARSTEKQIEIAAARGWRIREQDRARVKVGAYGTRSHSAELKRRNAIIAERFHSRGEQSTPYPFIPFVQRAGRIHIGRIRTQFYNVMFDKFEETFEKYKATGKAHKLNLG